MDHYILFVTMASLTILSPGPGVTLTLTNSIRYRMSDTFGGILGIAFGALVVAAISATGLGILLAASATAFTVMKYVGAAYLIYLGIKMWRSLPTMVRESDDVKSNMGRRFLEALALQLSNPKAIFFFLSIFPQFISDARPYAIQFFTLVFTYGCLVVVIHLLYAISASRVKRWLSSRRGSRVFNMVGGGAFVFFGLALATSKK
jgi:threonine/homoserine/homoserine lactone efflux protein